jgi:hypothetical protein
VTENSNKGAKQLAEKRNTWFLPDTLPDTPGGQVDTIWLENQAMMAALT